MSLKHIPNSKINCLIDEWIHSERDRKIMKRRFIDGIVYERIAEEFDLSVTQVKAVIYKSEKTLYEHIQKCE